MSSKPRSSLIQTLLLIGLMGGLGGILFWQKAGEQEEAREQQQILQRVIDAAPLAPIQVDDPFARNIREQAMKRLSEAEAATARIAELKKQRTEASRLPYLVVPALIHAKTKAIIRKDYLDYRLRELAAYRELTQDSGEAKAAGEVFLNAYLRQVGDRDRQNDDHTTLRELGQKAIDVGSRDPMLRTYFALSNYSVTTDKETAVREWEAALEELPKSKYPRIVASFASVFLRDVERDFDLRERRWRHAIPAIMEWLEEEAQSPQLLWGTSERFWRLWDSANDLEREQLGIACLLSKTADPYFGHVLAGIDYIDVAWRVRGGGWASEVKPKAWEGFEKNLKSAAAHLQYAWLLHPELPQAPDRMITIAMAGGVSEQPYFWFLRALEAQFDHESAYRSLIYSLTSRWTGNRATMYAFGSNCAETLRFDTLVPYQAVEILRHVKEMELGEGESLGHDPEAVKLLRRFWELRKLFRTDPVQRPMFEEAGGYRADLLLVLEDCGMNNEAAELIRESGDNINWTRLRPRNRPGRFLAARRLVEQSPLRERILAFDRKLQEPWSGPVDPVVFDELESERRALQSEAGDQQFSPDFPDYFAHAEVMLAQKRAFNSGEWFNLELRSNLAGWEPYVDSWSMNADTGVTLSGRKGHEDQIALRPLMFFPPPLEVTCEIEMLEPGPYLERAGIGWSREGMASIYDRGEGIPSFQTEVGSQKRPAGEGPTRMEYAAISLHERAASHSHPLKPQLDHQLRLKLWSDYAEFRADDAWYGIAINPLHSEGWLCFGQSYPRYQSTNLRVEYKGAVRFNKLRLRRLSIPRPPLPDASVDEQFAYWESRHQADPDDTIPAAKTVEYLTEKHANAEALKRVTALLERAPQAMNIRRWKAILLVRMKRYAEALVEFNKAQDELINDFELDAMHAELLATAPDPAVRNGTQALALATHLAALQRRVIQQALAAAHAEVGDFASAVRVQMQAMEADADVADALSTTRLEYYRAGKPWRLPKADLAQ